MKRLTCMFFIVRLSPGLLESVGTVSSFSLPTRAIRNPRNVFRRYGTTDEAAVDPSTLIPMGINEKLDTMEMNQSTDIDGMEVIKLSRRPPIFVVRNLLSKADCRHVLDSVDTLSPGQSVAGVYGADRTCDIAWLGNEDDPVMGKLAVKVHSTFLPYEALSFQAIEDLQVVRYDQGGQYTLHHDGKFRILTAIYYLDNVGETWFPLADTQHQTDRVEALKVCESLSPTIDGVRVSTNCNDIDDANHDFHIQAGDAVIFYNYFSNGQPQWNAIHAGLPATSTKWIANHWFHHTIRSERKE